jgi:hypothetical protein
MLLVARSVRNSLVEEGSLSTRMTQSSQSQFTKSNQHDASPHHPSVKNQRHSDLWQHHRTTTKQLWRPILLEYERTGRAG